MKVNQKPEREYITSLERGLEVLTCFSREAPELTISEIAGIVKLNSAVVRRCLHTLLYLGYVGKVGKYFILKPKVMCFGSAYMESMNLEEVFRPSLQELSDVTGDSASLAILTGNDITFLMYVSTIHTIQHYIGVGMRFPAYVAATGRIILAHRSSAEIKRYLKDVDIKIYTPNTVKSVPVLHKILKKTKADGYACVEGELDPNIISLAVPIFSADGVAVAAITCSTSIVRADGKMNTRLPALKEAAKKIEMELRKFPVLAHSMIC